MNEHTENTLTGAGFKTEGFEVAGLEGLSVADPFAGEHGELRRRMLAQPVSAEAWNPGGPAAGELTEGELIARFVEVMPAGARTTVPSGDDCALVTTSGAGFLVSTDVLVEGHHFKRQWSTPRQVGYRLGMQNFADVAAMGGVNTSLVCALAFAPDTPVEVLVSIAAGLGQAARVAGAGVDGGDLSGGDCLTLCATVMGDMEGLAPVLRSGARPGDTVAVAGTLGFSAAGLDLLLAGLGDPGGAGQRFVDVFRAPAPPLAAGPVAARAGANAMMDVSDGLGRDLGRIARASGVAVNLDSQLLAPYSAQLDDAAGLLGGSALRWVIGGGEDHSLVATFPPGVPLPRGFNPVGQIVADPAGNHDVTLDGAPLPVRSGWDHFAA